MPSPQASVLGEDLVAMGLSPSYRRRYRITHRIAYFIFCLRRAERRRQWRGPRRLLYYWARWRLDRVAERLGFDIPLDVFGPGLSIAHRGTIVVNGDAKIGARCRIHPGVTIGAVKGLAPRIGDNVFIGPNAGVYGGIQVGDSVVIGPHALVNFDVPDAATVFGVRGSLRAGNRSAE